jgi:uncharacterized protein YkwD
MSLLALLLLSTFAASSPTARSSAMASTPGVYPGSDFADEMVRGHNEVRAQVGAPPVRWNRDLARQAEAWAETNLRLGHLQHSTPQSRPRQGENLAAVYGGHIRPASLLSGWAGERSKYHSEPIDCGSPTDISMVGHYTQIIWRRTTEIGCGTASDLDNQVLVCRYRPPGNVCGQTP